MFAKIRLSLKHVPAIWIVLIILTILLACTVTTGFVWMQTDQVIAPPGLRLQQWFWGVFVL